MSNCEGCKNKDKCSGEEQCSIMFPKNGNVKNIIGVISGKGGVGKSTVTGTLAALLRKSGYKVGVLDADITGPSIPRFFGVNDERAMMIPGETENETKFEPVVTESGIKIMSLNLLIQNEDDPVIWRGPLITGVLNQMYSDTMWGELDYLLIDMPPGTGDIALTVMQSMPLKSMVIVSTPQDMVSMIVKKVVTMAEKMEVPVAGVVENMSYVACNKCGEKIRVFSRKSAEEQAEYLGLPLLAEMPIDLDLVDAMEEKRVESYIAYNVNYDSLLNNFLNNLN